MPKQVKLLILGKVWPEPNSSAAGSRMMQLIELFQENGWEITFASSASESDYSVDFSVLGINKISIKINDSSFDQFIKNLKPDIVLFDRFMTEEQFGWRVVEHCPDSVRILDTEDLHSLRFGRHQALKEGRNFEENDLLTDYAKREIASIYRCDLTLIISNYEMNLLKDVFKVETDLLYYLPFMLDPISENEIKEWNSFDKRSHFISIGNFLHEPNWDAVLYLKESIWPKIRAKLPVAELHIYGAYPSQKVFQLHNPKEGFCVKGRVADVLEVMQNYRVCLAPLRFGAGIKGKFVDAMQSGTPSITTSIGAEGMYNTLPWAGAIIDETDGFVDVAINLYSKEPLWKEAQIAGVDIINKVFPKDSIGEALVEQVLKLKEDLNTHRQKNFTGAMLLHHTLASTRFMSKWIEEKNK